MSVRVKSAAAKLNAISGAAFWYVAATISVIVLGANTPIPFFTLYQTAWHLSTGMLTDVYAFYTVGVVAAVFLIGPLSDSVGRRRVLLPAIGVMAAGLIACMFAPNVNGHYHRTGLTGHRHRRGHHDRSRHAR